ncbi:hypothetical protein MRB53_002061 [Persea americana]|uniref:Uncharacterized protein n=1 Tax=Persea americana TaxID=3435 RepID=A0ACC2MU27_PERAE|nr:hypothetical protein MRB53_002061 [Persea americana]
MMPGVAEPVVDPQCILKPLLLSNHLRGILTHSLCPMPNTRLSPKVSRLSIPVRWLLSPTLRTLPLVPQALSLKCGHYYEVCMDCPRPIEIPTWTMEVGGLTMTGVGRTINVVLF